MADLKKTSLYDHHKNMSAKFGGFAGYDMPLYYGEGVIAEHLWVRENTGLFDVSHMGQVMITGEPGGIDALEFVEQITPSAFSKLKAGRTKYTVLTNPEGGIIDDVMVTHAADNAFHFVLNAGRKDKDIAWIKQNMPQSLKFVHFEDWSLLALQGPKAESVAKEVMNLDLSDMPYMSMRSFDGVLMYISRLGYTGEDGFEIAIPNKDAPEFWERLCHHDDVKPIGLAARDSLRLEMGYPLYGHDIDETTSPVEADLAWIIGKNKSDYIGKPRIDKELANGISRRRIGLTLLDKGVAREGAMLFNEDGEEIGTMTSGSHSPVLKKSIGMGYVTPLLSKPGTHVYAEVRGRRLMAEVTPLPFIKPQTRSARPLDNTKKAAGV